MKKPMLNAIQKARMSMAMKSKSPKMNPGFDSLPKDVQAKIMNKRKPKMSITKPMLSKKKKEIPRYNVSGFVSKHTGLKPGRYEKAVIMNGVRNAAPSRRKKIMELLKSNAGTADMFKTTKPKMSMRKPKMSQPTASEFKNASRKGKRKIKRETKKQLKTLNKIDKGMKKAKASQTAGAIMKRERKMN